MWNMKVTVIQVVIGTLGTIPKKLVKGLEDSEIWGYVEPIQTTALLKSVRILRRVLETWEDLMSLKLQWETICNAGVKNCQMSKIIIITIIIMIVIYVLEYLHIICSVS